MLVEASVLIPVAGVAVRALRVDRAAKALRTVLSMTPAPPPVDPIRAASLVEAVGARLRATCLTRALVLQTVLARRGTETELVIGTVKDGERLRAHAWVEAGRSTLLGTRDDRLHPLYRLGAGGPRPV